MLKLDHIALNQGSLPLFKGVTLTAHKTHRIGLVGRNGTGKTSLLRLIQGELLADEGDMDIPGNWVISHVSQSIEEGDRSAFDYVLDGDQIFRSVEAALANAQQANDSDAIADAHDKMLQIEGYSTAARVGTLLHGLGIGSEDFDKPVKHFSGGWQMRLNLARALICRSDILLLDEPTNHLDLDAIAWLERWLTAYPGVLIVVSHDRDFLDTAVNRIWHIESEKIIAYTGNYAAFESLRAEKMAQLLSEAKRQQATVAHLQRFIDRFRAKATKAKQVQSRIKALEKLSITAMVSEEVDYRVEFLFPLSQADPLLELKNVSVGYDDVPILTDITFRISSGQRVALLGRNGAGKSTFMKLVARCLLPLSGERVESTKLKIGYLAQHQLEAFHAADTAIQYFMRENPAATDQETRNFLGRFGFGDRLTQAVSSYSGGEKTRLALATIIWQRPNLLLLDEPTNHLDLAMRDAILFALQTFEGAVILVSHDRHMLRSSVDQFYLVNQGKVVPFEEDLAAYQALLLKEERHEEKTSVPTENRKEKRRAEAETRALIKQRRQPLAKELKSIETEMETLNQQRLNFEAQLSDAGFYDTVDSAVLQSLLLQQAEVQRRLTELEERWLECQTEWEALGSVS